jgi:hypothetical protein
MATSITLYLFLPEHLGVVLVQVPRTEVGVQKHGAVPCAKPPSVSSRAALEE